MATKRPRPGRADSRASKAVKFVTGRRPKTILRTPIFSRFTITWVQINGVPFNTAGFFATLSRNGRVVAIASFDPFGVARFDNIPTLTPFTYTLRTFNPNGVLFRTRIVPAGVETFAVIG